MIGWKNKLKKKKSLASHNVTLKNAMHKYTERKTLKIIAFQIHKLSNQRTKNKFFYLMISLDISCSKWRLTKAMASVSALLMWVYIIRFAFLRPEICFFFSFLHLHFVQLDKAKTRTLIFTQNNITQRIKNTGKWNKQTKKNRGGIKYKMIVGKISGK